MAKLENDTKYVDFNYKEGYEVVNWLGVQETIKEWQGGSEKEKKKKKKPAESMSKPASQHVQHA